MQRASPRVWFAWSAVLVGGVSLALYASTLDDHLVSDDFDGIWESAEGRGSWLVLSRPGSFWRPLSRLTHLLVYRLAGLDPAGHHGVNVGLQVVNAILVVVVADALTRRCAPEVDVSRRRVVATLSGLVFAVLPQHAEAASWVSGRNDLLATFFALLCLRAWLTDRSWGRRVAVCSPLLLAALLSKESVVVLPAVLAVVDGAAAAGAPSRRDRLAAATSPWPLAVLVLVHVVVRGVVVGDLVGGYDVDAPGPMGLAANGIRLVLRSFVPALPVVAWWVAVTVLVGVAGLVGVLSWRRRSATGARPWTGARTLPGVLLLLTGLACLPVVGLGVVISDTRGDRLLYLPTVFAAMLVAVVVARWWDRRPAAAVAAAAVVLVGCVVSVAHANSDWDRAARVSERLVDGACALDPTRSSYLVDLPDRVGGAYAGRNALDAAGILRCGWRDGAPVSVLTSQTAGSVADRVEVAPVGTRRWRIRIEPGQTFEDLPGRDPNWLVEGFTVVSVAPDEIELSIAPGIDLDDVWLFSAGRWTRLAPDGR